MCGDGAIDDDHPYSRQITVLNALEHCFAGRMLRLVNHEEGCTPANFNDTTVKFSDLRGVSGRKANRLLRR